MEHRVDQLRSSILGAIREYLGAEDGNDTSKDDIINTMSSDELFEAWCKWEGLLGSYSVQIKSVVENIWQIELEEK